MIAIYLILAFFIAWSGLSYYYLQITEKPTYSVSENKRDYEIRSYDPYLVASIDTESESIEAANQGFGPLADYIYGNNAVQVDDTPGVKAKLFGGRGIIMRMCAPVLMKRNDSGSTVSFVLSNKYSLDTVPLPKNQKILVTLRPGKKMAAVKFSWYGTRKRARKIENKFLSKLRADGVEVVSSPELAFYNPPFAAPFLNRNEILVEVT